MALSSTERSRRRRERLKRAGVLTEPTELDVETTEALVDLGFLDGMLVDDPHAAMAALVKAARTQLGLSDDADATTLHGDSQDALHRGR